MLSPENTLREILRRISASSSDESVATLCRAAEEVVQSLHLRAAGSSSGELEEPRDMIAIYIHLEESLQRQVSTFLCLLIELYLFYLLFVLV